MARDGFRWEGDLFDGGIDAAESNIRKAMAATVMRQAPLVEAWMKSNATWRDQTGNARNGLFATGKFGKDKANIVVGHSVPYGIWLEVRWSGRYSIVAPAVEFWAPKTMELFSRLAFK